MLTCPQQRLCAKAKEDKTRLEGAASGVMLHHGFPSWGFVVSVYDAQMGNPH